MRRLLFVAVLSLGVLLTALGQTGTPNGILVTWNAVPGSTYNVYRSTTTTGPWKKLNTAPIVDTNYFEDKSVLTVGTAYFYVATAIGTNGRESPFSNQAPVTAPAVWPVNPPAPTGCAAKVK